MSIPLKRRDAPAEDATKRPDRGSGKPQGGQRSPQPAQRSPGAAPSTPQRAQRDGAPRNAPTGNQRGQQAQRAPQGRGPGQNGQRGPQGRGAPQGGRGPQGRGAPQGGRGPQGRGPQGGRAAPTAVTRGPVRPRGPVELPPTMTIRELSEALGVGAADILRELLKNGVMTNINAQIDYETAALIAAEFGIETSELKPEKPAGIYESVAEALAEEKPADLRPRPPVVTIMGHVDHGKTKLLDAIRSTRVAEGEAGGITQHIGAYQVEVQGRKITFLDTPGHEAFTAMRARGAQVTDIVVLVVAADDGVMPQTLEAIAHVKAANVPMIVAINKIDVPGANPDRVRQELAAADVLVEQWGGDVPCVEVSAKNKINIDGLLELILLVADIHEFKANPNRPAIGTIIEAELDKSRGPVATVLVQNGTLRLDDIVLAGATYGRVRTMFNDAGKRLRHAEPSTPVEILGLDNVPQAGDILQVVDSIELAREIAAQRARQRQAEATAGPSKAIGLDDLYAKIQAGQVREFNILLKADVTGSIGAIEHALAQLNQKHSEVQLRVIHSGTGAITESDVNLAIASKAIIIGFNARPDPAARRLAEQSGIEIRFYNIIYHLLEDLEQALVGMLAPEEREVINGYAEVRNTFRLPSREVVAGLYVTDGKISRNDRVRVLRNGVVIHDGRLSSLKRFKDDVREVQAGYECGAIIEGFNDVQVGDTMEFYRTEKVERSA
ncbi:translation initiation factor IF-2 [Kallotenue papyrolyticum]|uniref:translation initiation factor IF-2 n=1 Tax=Kallotenue papyrolyticum TaxID=1325125 RepID=UPI0004B78FA7|nr:translation initiation factor IF-2 [Kallotenue papyrolyticum]